MRRISSWVLLATLAITPTATQALPDKLQDWWLVSTSGYQNGQSRFYINRTDMISGQSVSKAWVDLYAYEKGAQRHSKWQMFAQCDDNAPKTRFGAGVNYAPDGSLEGQRRASYVWEDVVPDTSQETLWRFICNSAPENAIQFVPDGPESDASRFFRKYAAKR